VLDTGKVYVERKRRQSQNSPFIHPIMGDLNPYFIPKKAELTIAEFVILNNQRKNPKKSIWLSLSWRHVKNIASLAPEAFCFGSP
jgi:hypothetical protein